MSAETSETRMSEPLTKEELDRIEKTAWFAVLKPGSVERRCFASLRRAWQERATAEDMLAQYREIARTVRTAEREEIAQLFEDSLWCLQKGVPIDTRRRVASAIRDRGKEPARPENEKAREP